jgi:hypothetical protein
MRKTLTSLGLVLSGAAFAAMLGSCVPGPWFPTSTFPAPWLFPIVLDKTSAPPADALMFDVVEPCRLVDQAGADVNKIVFEESERIVWSNRTDETVVIEFSSFDIVGRDGLTLEAGESFTTTTRSGLGGGDYSARVVCQQGDAWVFGPTPPMEKEEPHP